ncbi:LPXTG cell wall anchor domain-containing protein [Streptococcus suis]|uniref:LPXTG cell wall anchor domain-containing protein n=1 Tax=Streptococcus suis TaxID=1307 RepID=UPI0038BE0877
MEKHEKIVTKKIGITLACTTLLGGVIAPVAVPAFQNIVYAETNQQQPISVAVIAISGSDGPLSHYYITINPGETKTISAPKVEGWKLDQYTNPTHELTYDQALKTLNSAGFVWVQFWMIKDAAPTTKDPVIFTVAHRVAGGDDLLLDNAVVNPGESITLTPIAVDGYIARADNKYTYTYDEVATGSSSLFVAEILYDKVAVDQPVEQPAEQPVETPAEQPTEQPTEQPADQPVEQPAEVPVEQPVEQPAEQPAEQPVEQPAETPTDKPVEQLTDASSLTDQTAGKVQVVAATDKKTVDKSAPSTTAVKPQEVSQPVAKTLPKTGDSSSMLLVLGGVLFGLSGLGLAATSRKRD